MRFPDQKQTQPSREGGQVITLFALFLTVLILFIGLGIDLGFAYITKAQLSKAVDAACLAGMSNWSQGAGTAHDIAISTFYANYPTNSGGRAASAVVVNANFTSANGNESLAVDATAKIKTYFIRVLPQWQTMTVGDVGKATRANLIMSLVLDKSGSMDPATGCSGGGAALPGAVAQFINNFDDNADKAAVYSFASSASNDVRMSQPFKANVTTAVNNLDWSGGTCSIAGLTNGLNAEVATTIPAGQTAVKVVVFFTDGLANMSQGVFGTPFNFGGHDPDPRGIPVYEVDFYRTNQSPHAQLTEVCSINTGGSCQTLTPSCIGVSTFTSTVGGSHPFCRSYVTDDATNRCVMIANAMRANGIYVFAIGLNSGPDATCQVPVELLQEVANDPGATNFDPTKPQGVAMIANSNSELTPVFQQIAADILLRLTQ